MSSGNVFERLFKLWASICKLVVDGKRNAEDVCNALQVIVEGKKLVEEKPAPPNINWREATQKAYAAMGMADESAEFFKTMTVKEKDGHWTVVMLKGLTCAKIIGAIKQAGSGFWSYYDDLDKSVSVNDRDPNRDGSYAIAVRSEVEADAENANKSANKLAKIGHKGMTLMERLLLELVYFLATGQHLDVKNWTLCTGSRSADGNVPYVYFDSDDGSIKVNDGSPGNSNDGVRSRSAVSLPTEASGAQP